MCRVGRETLLHYTMDVCIIASAIIQTSMTILYFAIWASGRKSAIKLIGYTLLVPHNSYRAYTRNVRCTSAVSSGRNPRQRYMKNHVEDK